MLVFLELVSPSASPEMAQIKSQHRAELKAALGVALASLSAHDRTLLRHRFVDGLSLVELSVLHSVGRATISRWLLRLRTALFLSMRVELKRRLQTTDSDFSQLLEAVQTSFEMSLGKALNSKKA